jgi:hypothetical protein
LVQKLLNAANNKEKNMVFLLRVLRDKAIAWFIENWYYFVVSIIFSVIALLSGYYFIHSEPSTIQYDLSSGILVSAIFTILTIIFLTVFIQAREERAWSKVKQLVFKRIEDLIIGLGFDVCCNIPNGIETYEEAKKQGSPKVNQFYFFEAINKIMHNISRIDQPDVFLLANEDDRQRFTEIKYELDSIIDTYFRFLSPNLTEPLVKVREAVKEVELSICNLIKVIEGNKNGKWTDEDLKEVIETNALTLAITFRHITNEIPKISDEIHKIIISHFY